MGKILRVFVFFILTIGLLFILDAVQTYTLTNSNYDKVYWSAKIKNKKYDFCFLGSSRVGLMLNTGILEKAWNKNGINLGDGGVNIMEQYLIIHKFFENKNKVSDIFISLDLIDDMGRWQNFNSRYRLSEFLPYIKNDKCIYNEVKKNFGAKQAFAWKYIPLLRYIQCNSRIGGMAVMNCLLPIKKHDFDIENGDIYGYKITDKGVWDLTPAKAMSSPKYYSYLEDIITLCEKNGAKIHLYTAPYFYSKYASCKNFDKVVDSALIPICKKHNIVYKNFCDMQMCRNTSYFYEQNHLNETGTLLFTGSLSRSYDLNTHSLIGPAL